MVTVYNPASRKKSAPIFARIAAYALAMSAFCLVVQHNAQAATPPPVTPMIAGGMASVDIQKVVAGYGKGAAAADALKAQADEYDSVFDLQKADSMLSATDQQALGALLLKPTKTTADAAQITAYQQRSQADASELTALQQKPDPTPDDTARLAALTKEQQAGAQALQDTSTNYRQLLDQKNQQANDALVALIKTAVAAVAQSRGIAVVFDSSVAIYAGNDITQLVIDRINAAK